MGLYLYFCVSVNKKECGNYFSPFKIALVTVHSHVNHPADWHGGCTYCLECISPIAKGDSKWRNKSIYPAHLPTKENKTGYTDIHY